MTEHEPGAAGQERATEAPVAPLIVAEIGCNHKGDVAVAREMIEIAANFAEVDYVKFQKRTNRELLTAAEYAAPHPNPANSYGATYGEHREFLEFDLDTHRELLEYCRTLGVGYACSVWDLSAAREIAALETEYIKIPSACNLDFAMLDYLARDYAGDIHISLGMTTPAEQDQIVARLDQLGASQRVVLYACTSGYPVPHEDVCLLEIARLHDSFAGSVKAIAFSGHHLGIALDVAAQTLGARWIERHYTLNRTWKGTDHAASLEPEGLRRLVRDTRAVAQALRVKGRAILDIEVAQRNKLKRLPGTHLG